MPEPEKARPQITAFSALQIWLTAALLLVVASLVFGLVLAQVLGGPDAKDLLSDPARSPLLNDPTWIAIGTLVNEAAALGAFALWWFKLKAPREAMPLGSPRPLAVLGALLLTFGTAPYAEAVGELVHRVVKNDVTASRVVVAAARGASDAELVLLLFSLAVVPALVEEALFRGLITAAFRNNMLLAVVVPSVMFGLFHLEPTQAAGTVLLGAAFGYARLCTDSLGVSMIAHGVYNAVVLLVVRFSAEVTEHEISIAPLLFGAVLIAAGVAVLRQQRVSKPPPA
ncbi:MAG TPA: CPBP family intramembrane metalloprotease [Polyangiaceae bacterium]|nr:CPBP family intramembrane metalloprotease [Polyangiaceae bacterium]